MTKVKTFVTSHAQLESSCTGMVTVKPPAQVLYSKRLFKMKIYVNFPVYPENFCILMELAIQFVMRNILVLQLKMSNSANWHAYLLNIYIGTSVVRPNVSTH